MMKEMLAFLHEQPDTTSRLTLPETFVKALIRRLSLEKLLVPTAKEHERRDAGLTKSNWGSLGWHDTQMLSKALYTISTRTDVLRAERHMETTLAFCLRNVLQRGTNGKMHSRLNSRNRATENVLRVGGKAVQLGLIGQPKKRPRMVRGIGAVAFQSA